MLIFHFAERLNIPEDQYANLEAGYPNPELLAMPVPVLLNLSIRWFDEPRAPVSPGIRPAQASGLRLFHKCTILGSTLASHNPVNAVAGEGF